MRWMACLGSSLGVVESKSTGVQFPTSALDFQGSELYRGLSRLLLVKFCLFYLLNRVWLRASTRTSVYRICILKCLQQLNNLWRHFSRYWRYSNEWNSQGLEILEAYILMEGWYINRRNQTVICAMKELKQWNSMKAGSRGRGWPLYTGWSELASLRKWQLNLITWKMRRHQLWEDTGVGHSNLSVTCGERTALRWRSFSQMCFKGLLCARSYARNWECNSE